MMPALIIGNQQSIQQSLWSTFTIWRLISRLLGFPGASAGEGSACNVGTLGSTPGLGRSPGEGNSYPLQYSGLENSMDFIVHGVTKSRTQQSNVHTSRLSTLKKLVTWSGDCSKPNTLFCRFSLVVCFVDTSVGMSIPISQFIPSHLSPWCSCLFFTSVVSFCSENRVISTIFLDSTYMCEYTILVFL